MKNYRNYFVLFSGALVNLLGEQAKWVPVSPQRVGNIIQSSTSLSVFINGALNEVAAFGFSINFKYQSVQCDFKSKTQMNIQLSISPSLQLSCI